MLIPPEEHHWNDSDGHPAGGTSYGPGMCISWQNGPLGRGDDRRGPNGAFVESVIQAAANRIRFYQNGKFRCAENEEALTHLEFALSALSKRTSRREKEGTEGTHSGT